MTRTITIDEPFSSEQTKIAISSTSPTCPCDLKDFLSGPITINTVSLQYQLSNRIRNY